MLEKNWQKLLQISFQIKLVENYKWFSNQPGPVHPISRGHPSSQWDQYYEGDGRSDLNSQFYLSHEESFIVQTFRQGIFCCLHQISIASQNVVWSSGLSFDKAGCVTAHAEEERVVCVSISLCQFMFPNKDVGLRPRDTSHLAQPP